MSRVECLPSQWDKWAVTVDAEWSGRRKGSEERGTALGDGAGASEGGAGGRAQLQGTGREAGTGRHPRGKERIVVNPSNQPD
jgi:hypothetical protein